jgi:hypothetical protein
VIHIHAKRDCQNPGTETEKRTRTRSVTETVTEIEEGTEIGAGTGIWTRIGTGARIRTATKGITVKKGSTETVLMTMIAIEAVILKGKGTCVSYAPNNLCSCNGSSYGLVTSVKLLTFEYSIIYDLYNTQAKGPRKRWTSQASLSFTLSLKGQG